MTQENPNSKLLVKINTDIGFWKDKNFKHEFGDLTVITGVNGSGKSQMLDWIWNNLTDVSTQNTINPPLSTNSVLYKKAGGSLANTRDILPTTIRMTQQFEDSYMHNIPATSESERRRLLWEHVNMKGWFCYYFTQQNQVFGHLQSSQDLLTAKINKFSKKKEYTDLLEKERGKQECSIIDIIKRIGELIRIDVINIHELSNVNGRDNLYLYSKINAILATIEDSNSKKLFKHRIQKPQSFRNSGDYTLTFVSEEGNEISFNELSSGEQVMFELLCYQYILSEDDYKDSQPKVILLDEFDVHLNPVLAKTFINVIQEQFVKSGIKVIMTTHSPSTVAYVPEENLFWMEEGKILEYEDKMDKMEILSRLSPGVLSTINPSNPSKDPYLMFLSDPLKPYYIFCEGETDILHFKTACKKLGGDYLLTLEYCNFLVMSGTKRNPCKQFLENFCNKDMKRKAIAIFDYDAAGMEEFELFKNEKSNHIITDDCVKAHKKNLQIVRIKPGEGTEFDIQKKYGYFPIELLHKKVNFDKYFTSDYICTTYYGNEERTEETDCSTSPPIQYHKRCYIGGDADIPADNKEKMKIFWTIYDKIEGDNEDFSKKMEFANAAKDFVDGDDFDGFKPTLGLVLKVIEEWEKTNPQPK